MRRLHILGAIAVVAVLAFASGAVTAGAQAATGGTINGDTIEGTFVLDGPPAFVIGFDLPPNLLGNLKSLTCPGAQVQLHGAPGGSPECIFPTKVQSTQFTIVGLGSWGNSVALGIVGSFDLATYVNLGQMNISVATPVPPVKPVPKPAPKTPKPAPSGKVQDNGSNQNWLWGLLIGMGLVVGAGGFVATRRGGGEVDVPTQVEQPTLPPNEVFTQPRPEYVSTGDTREKEGTGNPNVVGRDPADNQRDFGGEPVWLGTFKEREIRTGMKWRQWDDWGPPTIRVHYVDDPWFIPDPAFVSMDSGAKYDKAFRQMYDSGLLGEEFKNALLALKEPEVIVFFVAVIGIQFIPGVNVVVDAAAFVILLIAFGSQLDDFLTAMGKVSKSINKDQFDYAVKDLARIIAGTSTTALVALGFAGAKWAKGKFYDAPPSGGAAPKSEPVSPATKKPALNQGGVHDALPQEPVGSGKNPVLNQGGVHDALPDGPQEPLLPVKEHNPANVGPVTKLTPEEFAKWQADTNASWKDYEAWHKLNPGADPFEQPPKGWTPPETGPRGTQKLPSVPNTIEPKGHTEKYPGGAKPQPNAKAPNVAQHAPEPPAQPAKPTGSSGSGKHEPLLPVKEHNPANVGPVTKLTPEEFAKWQADTNASWKDYEAWHKLNPGADPFEQPPKGWTPPETGPQGAPKPAPPRPRPFRPRSQATGPSSVRGKDNPVGHLEKTYPPEIAKPVVDAYRLAEQALGGNVDGIAGSYAKGCPKVGKWPVATADEAMVLSKIPGDLSPGAQEALPPPIKTLFDLRVELGADGIPSDLDVISSETDPAKLSEAQKTIFEKTGIYVEFVEPM